LRKASGFAPPFEEVAQLSVAFGVDGLWQLGKPVTWQRVSGLIGGKKTGFGRGKE